MAHFAGVVQWRTVALGMAFAANACRTWNWGNPNGCTAFFRNFLSAGQECMVTLGDSCVKKFFKISVRAVRLPETLASIVILAHGNPFGSE